MTTRTSLASMNSTSAPCCFRYKDSRKADQSSPCPTTKSEKASVAMPGESTGVLLEWRALPNRPRSKRWSTHPRSRWPAGGTRACCSRHGGGRGRPAGAGPRQAAFSRRPRACRGSCPGRPGSPCPARYWARLIKLATQGKRGVARPPTCLAARAIMLSSRSVTLTGEVGWDPRAETTSMVRGQAFFIISLATSAMRSGVAMQVPPNLWTSQSAPLRNKKPRRDSSCGTESEPSLYTCAIHRNIPDVHSIRIEIGVLEPKQQVSTKAQRILNARARI